MVVVTIMAILITTSVIFGNNFLNSTAVKTATRDVASAMRLAHSKAGALKKSYLVVFDNQEPPGTQARVWVQEGITYDGTKVFGTERQLSKRAQIASLSHSWYPLVKVGTGYQGIDDPCQVGYMTFYWDGGAIPMTVKVCDSTPQQKYKYSLTVEQPTSRVKIRNHW